MDNFRGDLTDILRRGGGGSGSVSGGGGVDGAQPSDGVCNWQQQQFSLAQEQQDLFGDPFCNMRDPLLHELNAAYFTSPVPPSSSSSYPAPHLMLSSPPPPPPRKTGFDEVDLDLDGARTNSAVSAFRGGATSIFSHHQSAFGEEMRMSTPRRRPGGIFSRVQISPNSPVMTAATPPSPAGFNTTAVTAAASIGCLVENNNAGAVQIPSPRNLGIKRRKSQAKRVVCIPAPAATNSRPTGEVVPSDLWAWRKYGQKPIKGSPYPRGYYRCSSSKGCSARKQVERSRTDPNMLVITYTSEHNHPWPTQRNALAGSTRSTHLSTKTSNSGSSKTNNPKEEQVSCNAAASIGPVKEEIVEREDREVDEERPPETSTSATSTDHLHHAESYRPILMPPPPPSDQLQSTSRVSDADLFPELGEIDTTDPLHLLYDGGGGGGGGEMVRDKSKVLLEPFMSYFDWTTSTNTAATNGGNDNSLGEAKGGL